MFSLNLKAIRTPREHFDQVYKPEAVAAAFSNEHDTFTVVSPIELSFDVEKHKEEFQLTGNVRTTVELECSRCAEPYRFAVAAPFDLRYRPYTPPAPGEREILEEDFASAVYQNDEIDLGQLIRERLYLALPMKPLCAEDCRGLCPECGTNLNRGTCECRPAWEDPRLAVLKKLKRDS